MKLNGREARITTKHPASSYRIPVLTVKGEALGTAEATGTITGATRSQIARLKKAGYQALTFA